MSSEVNSDSVMTCAACGASIYQEHLHRALAGMWAGQLLCPACLKTKREGETTDQEPLLDSVPLTDAAESTELAGLGTEPGTYAGDSTEAGTETGPVGRGARHVRTFHAKLTDGAVRHLDEQINKWLAQNPGIQIKSSNTTVGVWEGKHPEPNLIVTIFY